MENNLRIRRVSNLLRATHLRFNMNLTATQIITQQINT